MNGFLSEIAAVSGLPFDSVFSSYRYVNLAGRAVYVEGHKGFVVFDKSRVVLRVEKKRLTITGEELYIKQISGSDAMVTGKILSVTVE